MSKREKKVKLLTLDTETYNGLIGELKKIAIYDGQKVYYGNSFKDVEPVIINYNKLGYEVHIYIHNMEFDMRKIPELFDKNNIIWKKSLFINGKVAKVSCKHYILHDSLKILPMSLSKLSKGFNVTHGKLDLWEQVEKQYPNQYKDIVDFLDRCEIDNPLYLEYLGYDVMSLYEVLQVLIDLTGMSLADFVSKVSTASISRHLFKNGYKGTAFKGELNSKTDYEMLCTYKWEKNLEVEDFLRMSYCGGRTEVFKPRLEKRGFHYDVNSLYPSVMIDGEYPIGKPDYTDNPKKAKSMYKTWLRDRLGLGFVNCLVHIPKQPIPPLPVKMGKLTFPCGTVYGTWTYEELEFATNECGVEILEYYACCHFSTTFPIFKRFVEEFYKLKEKGTVEKNEPLRTLAKLILNVGYGYTGMRRDKTGLDSFDNMSKYEKVLYADKETGFIEVPIEVKSEYIQVQVASYVTSRARLVLLKAMREVIKDGGNVYYCDTDSIVADIPLNSDLVDSSKLGYWDLEGEPLKGLFIRPKVYTEVYESEKLTIKFKGISKETQSNLNFNYYEYLYSELIKDEKDFEIVEKNKLQMRSILYMQKKQLELEYYETRDKKMNFKTVEKRKMFYDENYTEPHYFETLEDFENFSYSKREKEIEFSMV